MSQGLRYKFQGSTIEVQVGLGGGKAVTAITAADPAVVTSAAHGLADNDVIVFGTIPGMTQLSEAIEAVDVQSVNSFELVGVDASDYDAFVLNSPNTASFQPVLFSAFCEATGFNQQDGSATQIDVTTICSTAKEFELGLRDSGTLQLDFNWAGKTAIQAAIRAAQRDGSKLVVRLIMPGTGGTVILVGLVLQTSFQGAVDGVWQASMQMKLTGDIVVLD